MTKKIASPQPSNSLSTPERSRRVEEGTELVPPIVAGNYYRHRYVSFLVKVIDDRPDHRGNVKVHDGQGETWANPLHLYEAEED